MAELFQTSKQNISLHILNIFASGELDENVVVKYLLLTTQHGAIAGKTQNRQVKYYNLKMAIALGYRINSKIATEFRIWATEILHPTILNAKTTVDIEDKVPHQYFVNINNQLNTIEQMPLELYKQIYTLFYTARDADDYDDPEMTIFSHIQLKLHTYSKAAQAQLLAEYVKVARYMVERKYVTYTVDWIPIFQCILDATDSDANLLAYTTIEIEALITRKDKLHSPEVITDQDMYNLPKPHDSFLII